MREEAYKKLFMRTKENEHQARYYTNQTIRKKIDRRLHQLAALNAELGTDSTDEERQEIKEEMDAVMTQIKEIDEEFYNEINI